MLYVRIEKTDKSTSASFGKRKLEFLYILQPCSFANGNGKFAKKNGKN